MNEGTSRMAEDAGVAKLGPGTPAAEKRFNYALAGVITVILIVVALVIILKFHSSASGPATSASGHDAEKAKALNVQTIRVINITPRSVTNLVTTAWFEVRGDVDSLAKNIRPVNHGYQWEVMPNGDPTQIIRMPALGEAERHVTIKGFPTSIHIRIVPLQASVTAGLMAWELIPN